MEGFSKRAAVAAVVLCAGLAAWYFFAPTPQERIAHARAVAQTDPLWGLEGTDPARLSDAIDKLQETETKLAAIQKTPQDAHLVATALYPISFLRSLVVLEQARKAFIASSTLDSFAAYENAQHRARDAYSSDLRAFTAAFTEVVPADTAAYGTEAGVVTRESILQTLHALADAPGGPSTLAPAASTTAPAPRAILALYAQADTPAFLTNPLITLSQSACTGASSSTPTFSIKTFRDFGIDVPTPVFVGDLFLIPTAEHADLTYYRYYIDRGVTYVPWRPSSHYTCPVLLTDLGAVFALWYAGQGGIAPGPLELMLKQRSAGLDYMIYRMAAIEDTDMRLTTEGAAVEQSAPYLFFVRSAFYSLFLGPQTDAPVPAVLHDVPAPFVSYNNSALDSQKVIHDMRFFFTLHADQ